MAKSHKTLLLTISGTAVISAIIIAFKAYKEAPETSSMITGPTATLPAPAVTPISSEATTVNEQETVDSTLAPLLFSQTENNKEALITFESKEALKTFLNELNQHGLELIASSDNLLSVRVRFSEFSQLESLSSAKISPNYPVTLPPKPDVPPQDGAVAFGNSALRSIGITTDNSNWGKGVTVAVIDSGVTAHPALATGVTEINLSSATSETQISHGTAVASIISGDIAQTPGVAPAAEILSIRVTDSSGSSDSFTLSEGIIAAADSGAQIINISMGASNGSHVLENAISYAQDKGAIIVASAGNEGESTLSYPAAYPGVVSVGAIEATGEHLDFSNTGQNLSLSAPGFEVSAAWGENQRIGFSGTSASAPFVSGALAAVLSERPELSNQQAIELLQNNANEAGAVGADTYYGVGTLDLGRALESGQSGIYDAAVSSQFFEITENGTEELVIVVQNQGTETLFNSPVNIRTPLGTTNVSINSLLPGDTFTQRLPFDTSKPQGNFTIQTEIQSTTSEDNDLSNNAKLSTFETTEE